MTTSSTRRTFCHAPFTYWICYLRTLRFVKGSAICQHSPQIRRDHGVSDHIDIDPGFLIPWCYFLSSCCWRVCVCVCVSNLIWGFRSLFGPPRKRLPPTRNPRRRPVGAAAAAVLAAVPHAPETPRTSGDHHLSAPKWILCLFFAVFLWSAFKTQNGGTPQRRHQVAKQG